MQQTLVDVYRKQVSCRFVVQYCGLFNDKLYSLQSCFLYLTTKSSAIQFTGGVKNSSQQELLHVLHLGAPANMSNLDSGLHTCTIVSVLPRLGSDLVTYAPPSLPRAKRIPSGFTSSTYALLMQLKQTSDKSAENLIVQL